MSSVSIARPLTLSKRTADFFTEDVHPERLDPRQDSRCVVPVAEVRNNVCLDDALRHDVGHGSFQAISRREEKFSFFMRNEQQNAIVILTCSYPPCAASLHSSQI